MLRGSYRMSFSNTLRVGFSSADNIVLGESDHDDYRKVWGALGESETLKTIAENGVSNMFLELPHYRQGLINEFQSSVSAGGNGDIARFSQRFEHEDDHVHNRSRWSFNEAEETQAFLQGSVAPLLTNAARFDIDVHGIDYEKGRSELEARNEARRTVLETREEILRIQANENISDPAVAQRLTRLREQFQVQKSDYNEARLAYYNARHDDQDLAAKVNDSAPGQKTLSMLGFMHGSRVNDFEEHIQGRSIKIDIAESRASYVQEYDRQMENVQKLNPDFGNDPPELVYFIDEGVLATTVNTPPELVKQVELLSAGAFNAQDFVLPEQVPLGNSGMKNN